MWCPKKFYEGFKGLYKTFWCTTKKCENKKFNMIFNWNTAFWNTQDGECELLNRLLTSLTNLFYHTLNSKKVVCNAKTFFLSSFLIPGSKIRFTSCQNMGNYRTKKSTLFVSDKVLWFRYVTIDPFIPILLQNVFTVTISYLIGIYLFKVNNRKTRTRWEYVQS